MERYLKLKQALEFLLEEILILKIRIHSKIQEKASKYPHLQTFRNTTTEKQITFAA